MDTSTDSNDDVCRVHVDNLGDISNHGPSPPEVSTLPGHFSSLSVSSENKRPRKRQKEVEWLESRPYKGHSQGKDLVDQKVTSNRKPTSQPCKDGRLQQRGNDQVHQEQEATSNPKPATETTSSFDLGDNISSLSTTTMNILLNLTPDGAPAVAAGSNNITASPVARRPSESGQRITTGGLSEEEEKAGPAVDAPHDRGQQEQQAPSKQLERFLESHSNDVVCRVHVDNLGDICNHGPSPSEVSTLPGDFSSLSVSSENKRPTKRQKEVEWLESRPYKGHSQGKDLVDQKVTSNRKPTSQPCKDGRLQQRGNDQVHQEQEATSNPKPATDQTLTSEETSEVAAVAREPSESGQRITSGGLSEEQEEAGPEADGPVSLEPQQHTSDITATASPKTSTSARANVSTVELVFVRKVEGRDVLCGRGETTNRHEGNILFRRMTRYIFKGLHRNATDEEKTCLSLLVVDCVVSSGGRFLEKLGEEHYIVTGARAKSKAAAAFRDAEKKRKKPSEQTGSEVDDNDRALAKARVVGVALNLMRAGWRNEALSLLRADPDTAALTKAIELMMDGGKLMAEGEKLKEEGEKLKADGEKLKAERAKEILNRIVDAQIQAEKQVGVRKYFKVPEGKRIAAVYEVLPRHATFTDSSGRRIDAAKPPPEGSIREKKVITGSSSGNSDKTTPPKAESLDFGGMQSDCLHSKQGVGACQGQHQAPPITNAPFPAVTTPASGVATPAVSDGGGAGQITVVLQQRGSPERHDFVSFSAGEEGTIKIDELLHKVDGESKLFELDQGVEGDKVVPFFSVQTEIRDDPIVLGADKSLWFVCELRRAFNLKEMFILYVSFEVPKVKDAPRFRKKTG